MDESDKKTRPEPELTSSPQDIPCPSRASRLAEHDTQPSVATSVPITIPCRVGASAESGAFPSSPPKSNTFFEMKTMQQTPKSAEPSTKVIQAAGVEVCNVEDDNILPGSQSEPMSPKSVSSSPAKMVFGSLLSQRLTGVQMPVPTPESPVNSPASQIHSKQVSPNEPLYGSPMSQLSFTSSFTQGSDTSTLPTPVPKSTASTSPNIAVVSRQEPMNQSRKGRKNLSLKIGRKPTISESNKAEQTPSSLRSMFGSITIWKTGSILSRHLSHGDSNQRVNYVTEAQSVIPSLTSAFSIDQMDDIQPPGPLELNMFDLDANHRSVSHQAQLDHVEILDILEDSEYTDTVKSTDSAASLLRRSLSLPPQYHYQANRQPIQDIFQHPDIEGVRVDPITGRIVKVPQVPIPGTNEKWRQTMDDLLEQPEYMDSLESSCSKTGLLASHARALVQQGYGTKLLSDRATLSREDSTSRKQLQFIYFKNLIVLSVGFMFVFMAYTSLRNLLSSLYKEGGLGIIALSSIYGSLFIGCVFATSVVQYLRPKRTMLMCVGAMFLYVIANFYPTFYTLVPTCAIVGFCLSNMWTAHATYLTNIAARYAILVDDKVANVLSQFNGIFFAFFQIAQILGGLISSFVLSPKHAKSDDNNETMAIFNSTSNMSNLTSWTQELVVHTQQCGSAYCSADMNVNSTTMNVSISSTSLYILVGVYALCVIIGAVVLSICMDPLDGVMKKPHTSVLKQMTAVFRFYAQWKVVCLLGLMFYTLLQSSFLFGEFTKAFVTCTSGVYLVGYTMVCFSACSALSAFVSGRFQRYVGSLSLFCTGFGIHIILLIVLMVWIPTAEYIIVVFIIAGMWGLADGIINTQTISLFGVIFAECKEPAFAALKMCQSLGSFLMFITSDLLCTSAKLNILLVLAVLALSGYLTLHFLLQKHKRKPPNLNVGATAV